MKAHILNLVHHTHTAAPQFLDSLPLRIRSDNGLVGIVLSIEDGVSSLWRQERSTGGQSSTVGEPCQPEQTQKKLHAFQKAEQLAKIEAAGSQQRIAAVAHAAVQPVASEQAVVFGVTDHRFDHRAAFQPAFYFFRSHRVSVQ